MADTTEEKLNEIADTLARMEKRLDVIESARTVVDARPTGTPSADVTLQITRVPLGGSIKVNGREIPMSNTNAEGTRAVTAVPANEDVEIDISARGFKGRRFTVKGLAGDIKQIDGNLDLA